MTVQCFIRKKEMSKRESKKEWETTKVQAIISAKKMDDETNHGDGRMVRIHHMTIHLQQPAVSSTRTSVWGGSASGCWIMICGISDRSRALSLYA